MIIINMNIAKTVDIISHFQFANLRYHHQQKGKTCNIKRYSQKNIGTSLVQLKRKFSVGNIKLEHRMTGRQSHVWNFGDIPCGNDQSAGIRIFFNLSVDFRNLIDYISVCTFTASPLRTVHRAKVSVFIGPRSEERRVGKEWSSRGVT